jgi:hypothetical protein
VRSGAAAARLALGLALGALWATGAQAEVRRLEVEGRAPVAADADPSRAREAALRAALAEAVDRVAAAVADPAVPPPEEGWAARLGGDPARFTERYGVLEDLGELPAGAPAEPPGGTRGAGGPRERVLRVEAHVDVDRVTRRLEELGVPVSLGRAAPLERFVVEVRDPPGWPALARLREALREQGDAASVVPEQFEAGRAVLRVEAPGGPEALLARLLAALPPDLRVEPVAADASGLALRVELVAPEEPPAGAVDARE